MHDFPDGLLGNIGIRHFHCQLYQQAREQVVTRLQKVDGAALNGANNALSAPNKDRGLTLYVRVHRCRRNNLHKKVEQAQEQHLCDFEWHRGFVDYMLLFGSCVGEEGQEARDQGNESDGDVQGP